jgi:hypothetical protein
MGSFLMLAFASWNTVLGQTTVTTDKDDYAPGEYVKISGTGWEPGERVDFHFEETPKPETCANSHDNFAIADANGNIYYGGFLIKENHLGVHFVLTATGLTSGLIATTEFTDDASLVVGGNASLPTLLNITADRAANAASPVYTSLGNVIVREANGSSGRNDFTTSFNQIVLTAPIGWEYKTTGIGVSVTPNSGIRDVASVSILSSTTSTITISVSVTSSGTANTNTNDQITISGVEVRSTNGNSLPNSGSIVLGFTGTLESLTSPQNIVSLSQVAGALNNFFVESSAGGNIPNQTTGTAFNIKITARDQFNNTVTSFSGNPNDVAISSNATLTSGSGNTSNFSNGVLSSHSVTINPAFIAATITATKSSVTGTSNAFNVTGGTIGSVSVGTQSGASVYGTASSPTYSITSLRGSSGTVTGTYTVSGLPAGVSGGFSSNASFTANGPNVFPGATLTLSVGASVAAGSYNFTVALTENANSANRATTTGTLVVGKAGSTISVNAAGPFTFNNNPQGPDAVTKSGSAGSVTFSYVGVLPTTYAASAIKPTNAGSYQVTATVAEDDNFFGKSSSPFNFTINKANQTITVTTASPASAIFNTTFTVAATASSGLSVGYTSSAPLSNVDGLYTMNSGVGTGVVKYNQAGNDNYNAAPEVNEFVAAAKADQTITVTTASPASAIFNTTFTVAASASSSLAVVYTSTAPLSNVAGLYTMNSGIGTGVVKYNQSGNDNYNAAPEVTANVAAVKAESTISVNAAGPFTYNGSQQGPDQVTKTGSSGAVTFSYVGVPATTYAASATKPTNAGSYSVVATVAADDNYNAKSSVAYGFAIGKKALTITADDQTKFAGQANPTFTVSYSVFVQGESAANLGGTLGFATAATVASCAGLYDVMPSGLTSSNYQITFIDGTLTVTGLAIDASASSTPVALGSSATLRSIVSPAVSGVSVSFYLDDVLKGSSLTIGDGTATLIVSGLAADVYQVKAVVGGGCSISEVVFLPVYDPAGGFVTGGGWIDSPVGAMTGDKASAVGKANFGFNAKYKTGKNNTSEVDGNTNFQFKAGDLHFSSATHDNMQLVISGAKATYTGTGTVNGVGNHKFRVVAIDGQVSGGGGFDKFRIMIWDNNSSSTLLYDNKRGKSESSDDATVLGGGSIVIHKPAANGNKRVVTDLITVAWNTPVETIKKKVDQMGATWFESRKLAMTLNATAYDQLTPGFYELKADVVANEFFALDEPIAIQILVQDKPKALDVTISNDKLVKDIRSGQVVGVLSTIDAVDNIHTYTIAANADLILDGNKLIWKGTSIPARLDVTVFSTDRAGQTISREITLSRELKPGEFFLYPNPASSQTNVMVDLDQSATVAIRIFDAIGRLVVENEASRSGSFTQAINLDGLAAGMYTVQVNVGNMVMTKRLIKK